MPESDPNLHRHQLVTPYGAADQSKKAQVARMFDGIAPAYDRLNRLLSLRIDVLWRNRLIKGVLATKPDSLLDVATGTADLAIALAKKRSGLQVTGVDISIGMLSHGVVKVDQAGLAGRVTLEQGDSEALPYADGQFDAVVAAFGVRNFENLSQGLSEMQRVLRPGGHLAILEFSTPANGLVRAVFGLYFRQILPRVGGWLSRDRAAYTYLPDSVDTFPSGSAFTSLLTKAGLKNARAQPLTLGICTLYTATK